MNEENILIKNLEHGIRVFKVDKIPELDFKLIAETDYKSRDIKFYEDNIPLAIIEKINKANDKALIRMVA